MPWFGRLLAVAGLLAVAMIIVLVSLVVNQAARPVAVKPPPGAEPSAYVSPLTDAEIRQCADCHPAAGEAYFETPHAQTLTTASGEEVFSRFLGLDGTGTAVDDTLPGFRYHREGDQLFAQADSTDRTVQVDWIFGSGRRSQTPVAWTMTPAGLLEGLEMHLSWYPEVGLSRTFDHAGEIGHGLRSLGIYESQETLTACFDCHTTGLHVVFGQPDVNSFIPGVRCDRCHDGARTHLASAGEVAMPRLSELTPAASIELCGTCHRTPSSESVQKYALDDPKLARFAPVGLSRSDCFTQQSERRLDCATCHDPHRPPSDDESFYVARCLDCHSSVAQPCSDQPATSNCLPCHMPKHRLDRHLEFTDHWIRVFANEVSQSKAQAASLP